MRSGRLLPFRSKHRAKDGTAHVTTCGGDSQITSEPPVGEVALDQRRLRRQRLAALAWLAVSLLFSWYFGNFANYNGTYGALGAVVGLMNLTCARRTMP
jgi:hypothetical protein